MSTKYNLKEAIENIGYHSNQIGFAARTNMIGTRLIGNSELGCPANLLEGLYWADFYGALLAEVYTKRLSAKQMSSSATMKIKANITREFAKLTNNIVTLLAPADVAGFQWRHRPIPSSIGLPNKLMTDAAAKALAKLIPIAYSDTNTLTSFLITPLVELVAESHMATVSDSYTVPTSVDSPEKVIEWVSTSRAKKIGRRKGMPQSPIAVPGRYSEVLLGLGSDYSEIFKVDTKEPIPAGTYVKFSGNCYTNLSAVTSDPKDFDIYSKNWFRIY